MFGNENESIKSDSERINNEELFISSMLEATEDDIAPEDYWEPNPKMSRIHVKEGLPKLYEKSLRNLFL